MERKTVIINAQGGSEVSPVAKLVQIACQFESAIHLENGSRKVNAKSIMGMMALTLDKGMEVTIYAEGNDECAAIAEMASFLNC